MGTFWKYIQKKKATTDDKPRMNILYSFLDNFSLPGTSLIGYFFDDVTWQAIKNITKMDPNEIECFNDELEEEKENPKGKPPSYADKNGGYFNRLENDKDPSSSTDDADGDAADSASKDAEGLAGDDVADTVVNGADNSNLHTVSSGQEETQRRHLRREPASITDEQQQQLIKQQRKGGNPSQNFSTFQQYPYGQQQQIQNGQYQGHQQQYQQQHQHQQQQYQQQYQGQQHPLYQSSYVKPYQRYDIQHS